MIKTNKLILLILLTVSSLLSNDINSSTRDNISSAIGFGSGGMIYRQYSDDGYIEYSGNLFYKKNEHITTLNLGAGLGIGKYLYLNYNKDLDFGIKYVYGVSIDHISNSFKYKDDSFDFGDRSTNSNASAYVMLGVEIISPRQEGLNIELLMGQKIQYGSNSNLLSATTGSIQFMFNY